MRKASVLMMLLAPMLTACGANAMPPQEGQRAATTTQASEPQAEVAAKKGIRLVSVGTFSSPLAAVAAPGDPRRLYVVQQTGQIMVLRGGHKLARPFLDIGSRITSGGEQGLLGLAFAPDFTRSKLFYVYFTSRDGSSNEVVEFRAASRDRARAGSARVVLRMPNLEANHNGGNIVFGPDGLLYIGTGDGGGGNDQHGTRGNAQDLGSPLGKLLRIDPVKRGGRAYTIPASNPFAGRAGARGEIYSYGLRNPWRFSFDRANGALIIGDVGQDAVEEIDYMAKGKASGANFGWRPIEGNRKNFDEPAPGAVGPVITHTHDEGFSSITGGFVVRDKNVPALYGRYVYSDLSQDTVWAAKLSAGKATGVGKLAGLRSLSAIVSFGEDARGRVYVVSINGPVYRFASR
ncbi:MAG: PQQ-dependent sugar dehydrogenase [Solirubrobacteraceae bacterium]